MVGPRLFVGNQGPTAALKTGLRQPVRGFSLAPVLRAMPDVQDLGYVILKSVNDNVRRAVQFAGSFDFLAGAAKEGEILQVLDTAKNSPGNLAGSLGVIL